ncbi:MAG: restriction endonuclease subunit S [Gammaproteobacteria bacterium]|nr:restriction endonuclease subunit S [Gammaproteobacteria bacterium]
MTEVATVPLGEIADIVRGVTFSKAEVTSNPTSGFLPVVRAGNIQDSLLLEKDLVYVPHEKVNVEQILRSGDIIICTSSGSSEVVGKTAIAERDWEGTFGAFCAGIRANPEICDPNYLFYYLRSPAFRSWTSRSSGISIKNIRKSELDLFKVPLPSLPEQRRIASILTKADVIRRKRKQIIKLTDNLLKSIFIKMFGDPGQNPHRWPVMTIGDLTKSTQYGTSSKAGPDGEYPILRMNNLTYDGQINCRDMKYIDLSHDEIDKYTVVKGDILFNRTNSAELVGKTAVYQGEDRLAFAGYLIRLRTNKQALPDYVSGFLNSAYGKAKLRGMCRSIIGMANINAKELCSISIPVPSIDIQRLYQQRLEAIINLATLIRKKINTDNELLLSISRQAFGGEL